MVFQKHWWYMISVIYTKGQVLPGLQDSSAVRINMLSGTSQKPFLIKFKSFSLRWL